MLLEFVWAVLVASIVSLALQIPVRRRIRRYRNIVDLLLAEADTLATLADWPSVTVPTLDLMDARTAGRASHARFVRSVILEGLAK